MRQTQVIKAAMTLFVLSACKGPSPELATVDVAAVKANYTDWATATANKDTAAIAKLVTADEWISNPNQAAIIGREATVVWTKAWPSDMRQTWVVDEVSGYLDMAFSRATVTESYSLPDGKLVTEHAVCVNIHRRQPDGSWQFSRSMCHSIDPLPPAPTAKKP